MKLTTYLSLSRHGIYYFRWPLPRTKDYKRQSVRVSLLTRCPDRAGDLSRYLASCGRLIRDDSALAQLRQDEIREMVRNYFQNKLKQYGELLNGAGISDRYLNAMKEELEYHEDAASECNDFSDQIINDMSLEFCSSSGLSNSQWKDNEVNLRKEIRKAKRDQLTASIRAAEGLEHYSFDPQPKAPSTPPQPLSAPLGEAINDFMAEHSREWPDKTARQIRAYLDVLLEYFGENRLLGSITKKNAGEVKKVVQALPVNRKIKSETKDLPLLEMIKVSNLKTIAPKTINGHIDTFRRFFDWAERHGHSPHKLFDGMKVAKAKGADTDRSAFTKAQTELIFSEITENTSSLVKKHYQKWGSLLGLFTGARLREIAQLDVSDIKQEGDIWYIDINEDGENKSLKSASAKRRVPIHSELIRLGFLNFVGKQQNDQRLFLELSYNKSDGYGRNLGRWFNGRLLKELDIKTPGLVFHCCRHTMVTRLGQAGVPEPIIQCIVGHAREGVTQEVYLREGYTLVQLQEAIEKFSIQ